jgi:hypothetical protein
MWNWPDLLPLGPRDGFGTLDGLRSIGVPLLLLVCWNATTRDHDIVAGGPSSTQRLALSLVALGSWFSPGPYLLAVALLSLRFHFWQHHASFPMRVLLLTAATLVYAQIGRLLAAVVPDPFLADVAAATSSSLLLLLTAFFVSHYLITALAKIALGPRPWSWMLRNRLHYLAASAYSWGWARFVPWRRYGRFVRLLQQIERPLQISVFVLELGSVMAFFDAKLAGVLCFAFAGFHLGVLAVAGLFFWDWIATDLILGVLFWNLPDELTGRAFGPTAGLLGLAILVAFPLRHKLWRPMPLGWYDSPLTQRVSYRVRGKSGQVYGLYNDFMCPHERLYGKVHGCFAFAGRVVTYHLGEVFRLPLRDAIVAAGPSLAKLDRVKQQYGIEPYSTSLCMQHLRYLKAFFWRLNLGTHKSVLPKFLRFLKAPGDQLFYWGPLPAFRGQEPVSTVELCYREEYFDGRELCLLAEELLLVSRIPESDAAVEAVQEITPRRLDEFLLALAQGRLIELPGYKQAYLHGDDGAPLAEELDKPPGGTPLRSSAQPGLGPV